MSLQKVELPFDVDLLPVKKLTAGNLSCLYENGNLRYIKWGDEEVVRMIYTAVRDEDWATAPYRIRDEEIEEGLNSFFIRYTAIYKLNEIHYKANVEIKGEERRISFFMQGEALSDFLSNRIGICVHHPVPECAGKRVVIAHPDGTKSEARFPEQISPHQPFKEVRQMEWQTDSFATVRLQFVGDVFETEDQRNWTDYSFKTYSTPLDIPIPVQVKNADTVRQSVSLNISSSEVKQSVSSKENNAAETKRLPFPKIGFERAHGSSQLTADELLLLQEITFDHYRVVLHLSKDSWIDELEFAAAEAKLLSVPMEIVAFFPSVIGDDLAALSVNLQRFSEQVISVLVLQEKKTVTPPELLQKVYTILKHNLPQVLIGYGTDAFFSELNRNRPSPDLPFDFVSYGLNPQVHATDTRTLRENIAAQKDTVEMAKAFAPGKKIFVSPVTFKFRAEEQQNDSPPSDEDSRMYTSFGAMWTLLSLKNLAGADVITLYQAKSYRGILSNAIEPTETPLYNVLKELKTFAPKWMLFDQGNKEGVKIENGEGAQITFCFSGKEII